MFAWNEVLVLALAQGAGGTNPFEAAILSVSGVRSCQTGKAWPSP